MRCIGEADLERRFGGLRRLYGDAGYARMRAARVAVVGLGGVGSWAAEALARSGVAALTLIDLDHVAESNINRQVQALGATLGMAKVQALRERIADIHPGCVVHAVEEFAERRQLAGAAAAAGRCGDRRLRPGARQGGDRRLGAARRSTPLVVAGAAGGKRRPQAVEVDDLAAVTHDPLLASLRQRLRKQHGAARKGPIGVRCVFSREPVRGAAGRGLRRRGQPQLPRLRLERERDRDLRHGGRARLR